MSETGQIQFYQRCAVCGWSYPNSITHICNGAPIIPNHRTLHPCFECAKNAEGITRLTAEYAELKRKLDVADKGLAHYADESTWEHHSSGVDGADKRQYRAVCYNGTPTGDGWVVAREALGGRCITECALPWSPEEIAKRFHEAYELLAPQFGYQTRPETAGPWADVPENNKELMIAVIRNVFIEQAREALAEMENEPEVE